MTASTEGRITTRFVSEGSDELARDAREAAQALEGVGGEAREASGSLEQYESSARGAAESSSGLSDAARESTQQTALLQQRLSSLAGGLSGLGSILGTESELGSVVGRMGQFASTGLQLGMVFGPTGAVVGGILGAAVPALQELYTEVTGVGQAQEIAARQAQEHTARLRDQAEAASAATTQLTALRTAARAQRTEEESRATLERLRGRAATLDDAGQAPEIRSAEEARMRAGLLRQQIEERERLRNVVLTDRQAQAAFERQNASAFAARIGLFGSLEQQAEQEVSRLENLARDMEERERQDRDRGGGGGGGGRGGRRGDDGDRLRDSKIRELEREKERQAEIAFADTIAQLEAERIDAEEAAARRRAEERRDAEKAAQDAWDSAMRRDEEASRLRERQQREEADRVERANRIRQRQTQAWRDLSGEMLGTTLEGANAIGGAFAGAFEQAITGQESFDVAFAKGAKSALIQFGTAQVAEGIGALLTAAGNVILNPPAAATKAVEGAGKIALGVSLGAAGAAISVPSSGAADTQSDRAPRLGPADQGSAESRAVVVNLNAPSIVAGTRAQLGREMGRAISDGTRRFGRAAA